MLVEKRVELGLGELGKKTPIRSSKTPLYWIAGGCLLSAPCSFPFSMFGPDLISDEWSADCDSIIGAVTPTAHQNAEVEGQHEKMSK